MNFFENIDENKHDVEQPISAKLHRNLHRNVPQLKGYLLPVYALRRFYAENSPRTMNPNYIELRRTPEGRAILAGVGSGGSFF